MYNVILRKIFSEQTNVHTNVFGQTAGHLAHLEPGSRATRTYWEKIVEMFPRYIEQWKKCKKLECSKPDCRTESTIPQLIYAQKSNVMGMGKYFDYDDERVLEGSSLLLLLFFSHLSLSTFFKLNYFYSLFQCHCDLFSLQ